LTKVRSVIFSQASPTRLFAILTIALFGVLTPIARAQETAQAPPPMEAMLVLPDAAALPDSPGAILVNSSSSLADTSSEADGQAAATSTTGPARATVGPHIKLIASNQLAPPQTAGNKVVMGLRDTVTPFSAIGWLFSAGWTQLIDGAPNYGTNSEAFGKRLGAAAALSTSRGIFTDCILGPAFHQDTRYYQLGRDHKFFNRVIYASTRPVIGKTDGGRDIPNYASLIGGAGGAALTYTYYPERNQTGGQVATTFATGIGSAVLNNLFNEFGGDIIQALNLSKSK
jgi:hypothetical protein